ncbi:MAG: hypothetical protein ACR2KK_09160 [Acidimicrobiales bacterium]
MGRRCRAGRRPTAASLPLTDTPASWKPGDDAIVGGPGRDVIFAGADDGPPFLPQGGADRLVGAPGTTSWSGSLLRRPHGADGDDRFTGFGGDDRIVGGGHSPFAAARELPDFRLDRLVLQRRWN